jgi:hypothetical protein
VDEARGAGSEAPTNGTLRPAADPTSRKATLACASGVPGEAGCPTLSTVAGYPGARVASPSLR